MDNNQKRFVEDALDLLDDLDEGLMQLEAHPTASAPLEQVFRTMHTIKGGANMFGFNVVGELAHQLETLFDFVRNGKAQVSGDLISLTLQSFDRVRDLLKEKDEQKINDRSNYAEYLAAAETLLQVTEQSMPSSLGVSAKDEVATYFISVTPTIDVTPDGTHQLVFIMKDLEALGTARTKIFLKEDQHTILKWHQFLSGTVTIAEIESYFLFVDGDCKFEVIKVGVGNLLQSPQFESVVEDFNAEKIGWESLLKVADQCARVLKETREEELHETATTSSHAKKRFGNDAIIKVNKRKIDDLLNWISELIVLQGQVTTVAQASNHPKFLAISEQLEMITSRLRDTSLEIGLVPIETLVIKFKRLVRDLSKGLGKKVNFLSEGADTEMDKDVIELLEEPMIHLIRNAVDHGIGVPEERKSIGKNEYGTVRLKAFNSNTYINIIISDDGRGIAKEAVFRKAVEKGIVDADAMLSDEEIFALIFKPGLSTASQVSDVSGRGVGMDVVMQKIADLRGTITVKSEIGKGTSFHIKLPLSRSMIEGLLVRVDDTRYIIPLNMVDRIDRIPYHELDKEDQLNQMTVVNEQPLKVLSLRKEFHPKTPVPKTADIISVTIDGVRRGIAVDRIEGKMQTVLKPLGDLYQKQDYISGSTILGNGSLALVLDPARLFNIVLN